ncbi:MAG TPA: ADOP family duplicated permease [Vicinamibacterales bacterium]|nr:ADOP family duplicated permease [Vicinamibacterales bacterium]
MTGLTQASRVLVRRPLFLSASILTIGAGVAITTALFSVVDRVLLQPLPFPDGGQLVSIYEARTSGQERTSLVAPVRLEDWNRLNRTFAAIAGSYSENVTDTSGGEPERLEGRRVSARFFKVFGMAPVHGRTFTDEEERFGGPTAAVISEALWTRRFARDLSVVGKTLTIGGRGYAIVGVMPREFTSAATDVWIPAQFNDWLLNARDARFLGGVGRMSPGVTLEQARADLARVQHALGGQYPKTDKDSAVEIRDLKEVRVGDYRRALVLLFGAVALLFVIAIANVAGLMLVQLHRRAGEFAIRRAIGASDRQIVTVVLLEAVLIAVAGCAAGAAASVWLTRAIATTFATVPRMVEVALDARALGFAAGASLLAVGAFGLIPALFAARREILPMLTPTGRRVSGGRHRLQGALVVSQIALSMLLAGSAALLVRSYGAMTRVALGFETANVFTFHVGAAWDEDRKLVRQLQQQILTGLQQLPGVQAAGFTNFLPAGGATLRYQVRVDGVAGPGEDGKLTVGTRSVSAGYLEALRVGLVAGEWCPDLQLGVTQGRSVIVNRRFVDLYGGGTSLVGRQLRLEQFPPSRIVGVIGNVLEDGASAPVMPYIYMCVGAGWWPDPSYVVRAEGDPRTVIAAVRHLVRSLDPGRPVFGIKMLDEVIGDGLEQPRINARLLALFAAAALGLAALGMYGLLMLLVAERHRELGVRMALGASPLDLIRLVLTGASRLVVSGMAVGLVLTLAAGHAFRAMLFGVAPHDPRALFAGVLALMVVSVAAILIPARKAATVSPTEAMRGE